MEIFRKTMRKDIKSPGGEAEAWKKAEMVKIEQRYEKLNEVIRSWEEKKRTKARRKLDKTESELEKRRIKAMQKFQDDMDYIEQIAAGARAQAAEKRRSEELKVKEKANMMRATGKIQSTWF